MKSRRSLVALVAALSVGLAVPSASDALTIGEGNVFSSPGVAVDAAGTAYIAWRGPESGVGSLQFCRLPRGATACDIRHAIAAPGDTVSRAFVTVSGSRVTVLQYRYGAGDGMYRFTSVDGGVSFGPGEAVGSVPFSEAVVGPGDTLSGVTNAESIGEAFQNVPLTGSSGPATYAMLSADHPYNGAVGLIDAATPLAVFTDGSDAAQFRRYDGTGSLNDVANWTPPADLGVARYPKLAGGPSGLLLLATSPDGSVFARKWNGVTFGPPVSIGAGADPATLHASQDAAGRFHVIFVRSDAEGLHLIHAVSDDGVTWRSGTVTTQSAATDGGLSATRIAIAPDHVGVAVWNAGFKEIRVAAIGPDAPGPPQTKIGKAPKKTTFKPKARFTFTSTKPGSTFECKVDKQKFSACKSPKKVKVKPGKHVFQVRGVDAAGVADASPARVKWKVLKHTRR